MSSLHLPPSWIQLDPKYKAINYRRVFLLAGCMIGTALISTLLVTATSFHPAGSALAPRQTSLQVRAEYPVSTYVYERGFFAWFIGIAGSVAVTSAIAFSSLGPACVIAGPITVGACVVGAIGAVAAAAAIASSLTRTSELKLMRQSMVYMEAVDKSSKREISHVEHFFSELYGVDDYRFEGSITGADKFNSHLVERNNGEAVPVFSFTSPQGIRFHHAIVYNDDGSAFHRFGFPPAPASRIKRTTIYAEYDDNVYFKSGGIDALKSGDIHNGNDQYLTSGDFDKMAKELQCADSNVASFGELGVQVYDATTQETIGFATIAPVQADGDTVLFTGAKYSPPLTQGDNCAQQTSSD
jgi:hypothetical protein